MGPAGILLVASLMLGPALPVGPLEQVLVPGWLRRDEAVGGEPAPALPGPAGRRRDGPAGELACRRSASLSFPEGFLWGTATAAHQVEGGNTGNDWWRWEQVPGHIAGGDVSGEAADHYHRYPEDLRLARELGSNAYRFSIEWSRVEPEPGVHDPEALAHYRRVLEACRANGLRPMVTLFHFTLPLWAADQGGMESPTVIDRFGRFAALMGREFGDQVDLWCTVNEPVVYAAAGYMAGVFPPGKQDPRAATRALAGLLAAHALAAEALRREDRLDADGDGHATRIGLAKHLRIFEPARRWDLRDRVAAGRLRRIFNEAFLEGVTEGRTVFALPGAPPLRIEDPRLRRSLDFLGVNYYTRDMVRVSSDHPGGVELGVKPGAPTTDMGWEIHPRGFLHLLRWVRRFDLPVYVTENGMADAAGHARASFLREHGAAMHQALQEGTDVRGYFHWSLMDNFEWAEGFAPRFGLYHVDYTTQQRTLTEGGRAFAELASGVGPDSRRAPDARRRSLWRKIWRLLW